MLPGAKSLLLTASPKEAKEEIELDNIKNIGYQGRLWFGNPSQNMKVIFDTGSSLAWLYSEQCDDRQSCPATEKRFLESKSKDFRINEHAGETLHYGKGSIVGHPA